MIVNVTPANSPYSIPASVFNPSIPGTPNITLRFSGGAVTVILPQVSALSVQQGTIDAIIMDDITSVTLQTSGTDVFSGLSNIGNTQSLSVAAGASKVYVTGAIEASVLTGPDGINSWVIKKGFS